MDINNKILTLCMSILLCVGTLALSTLMLYLVVYLFSIMKGLI